VSRFGDQLLETADLTRKRIDSLLSTDGLGAEAGLLEAMRYMSLSSGKMLRSFMVVAVSDMLNVSRQSSIIVGSVAELIHTYSLIHDDLPSMDNDDMRRGKASCHRQYSEATAILAGDALLTFAFEILANRETHPDPVIRNNLVAEMARSIGFTGMAGGQYIDMNSKDGALTLDEIVHLQKLKTGALIKFSCESGAIMANVEEPIRNSIKRYAHDIGIAYQIADDLLDVTTNTKTLGKTAGKDQKQGKATFVKILGKEQARKQAEMLVKQAIEHLHVFGKEADLLRDLAEFILTRKK
jgi:farnesyl diphosphate synthase